MEHDVANLQNNETEICKMKFRKRTMQYRTRRPQGITMTKRKKQLTSFEALESVSVEAEEAHTMACERKRKNEKGF